MRVLRVIAILVALGGVFDPPVSLSRPVPTPVRVHVDRSDPDAADVEARLRAALKGRLEFAGPDRAAPERPAQGDRLVNRVAPLEDIEREAILMALDEARGTRRQAADRLGISRSSIYERIRRLAIGAQRPAACPV